MCVHLEYMHVYSLFDKVFSFFSSFFLNRKSFPFLSVGKKKKICIQHSVSELKYLNLSDYTEQTCKQLVIRPFLSDHARHFSNWYQIIGREHQLTKTGL